MGDVIAFNKPHPEPQAPIGFAPLPFRQHLYSLFPVEDMVYHEDEGTEHLAEAGSKEQVADYFAAFGVQFPERTSADVLNQAWGYLSCEPGHWADYLLSATSDLNSDPWHLLKHNLTDPEQAYVNAIAKNHRTAARELLTQTRWHLGLQQKIRDA